MNEATIRTIRKNEDSIRKSIAARFWEEQRFLGSHFAISTTSNNLLLLDFLLYSGDMIL